MSTVIIEFKDGRPDRIIEGGLRAGGSFDASVKYEEGFVVVTDDYGNTTAFPTEDVKEVRRTSNRMRW